MRAGRHEPLTLHSNVAAVGQAGDRDQRAPAIGSDGKKLPRCFIGEDQIPREVAKRGRRNRDSPFGSRSIAGDRCDSATAVDRVNGRACAIADRHEQLVTEAARLVERDAVDQTGRFQRGEAPDATSSADRHDAPSRCEPQRVDGAVSEGATGGERDIRLLTTWTDVSACKRLRLTVWRQKLQASGRRQVERSVGARAHKV